MANLALALVAPPAVLAHDVEIIKGRNDQKGEERERTS